MKYDDEAEYQLHDELRAKLRNEEITLDGAAEQLAEFLWHSLALARPSRRRIRVLAARIAEQLDREARKEKEE